MHHPSFLSMLHSLWAAKTDKHSLKNAGTERAVGDKESHKARMQKVGEIMMHKAESARPMTDCG